MYNNIKLIFILFFVGCILFFAWSVYTTFARALNKSALNINYVLTNYK
jgi:hypothetical protein